MGVLYLLIVGLRLRNEKKKFCMLIGLVYFCFELELGCYFGFFFNQLNFNVELEVRYFLNILDLE